MKALFYIFGVLCIYSYFLYPLILKLIPSRNNSRTSGVGSTDSGNDLPKLSLIITVHNEGARIREKLENTRQIVYPTGLLEIFVASDSSTDETDSIVESYADKGIQLVRADERKGKEYAQLCAIHESKGEILVFSDVATQIPVNALQILAARFSDPQVGALSSEDQVISNDGSVMGEGLYVKYEMWLRRLESDRAGLVGLSGSFFAARREVCEDWDIHCPSDFNIALNCAKKKFVAVTSSDVVGVYKDVDDSSLEYTRKIRTVIRGITAIVTHPEVLNPFRLGVFAFQVWSHKIMRWGVPWFLLSFGIFTLLLQDEGGVFRLALVAQLVFYGLAMVGWLSKRLRKNIFVKIIYFFVNTNIALGTASLLYLAGKRITVWSPSKR